VNAVQTHMRDKGHCMIDMSELVDFWDMDMVEGGEKNWMDDIETKLPLPSGLVLESRHSSGGAKTASGAANPSSAPSRRRGSRHRDLIVAITVAESSLSQQPPATHSQPGNLSLYHNSNDPHRKLTTTPRTEKGLTGLSNQQLRTLQIVDRKMKSREESATAKRKYASQQQPVKTVYYKTENPVYQAG